MSKSEQWPQLKVKASYVDEDRPHHRDGWWYISTGDGISHLHSDGVIREGTDHEGNPLGWYRTKEQAQAAIDAYESTQARKNADDNQGYLLDCRYIEMKRLAEMAWVALLASPSNCPKEQFAEAAWLNAEAMYDESKRRDPHNDQPKGE